VKEIKMPWEPKDAHEHKKDLTTDQVQKWATIANAVLKQCREQNGTDCDGKAIRIANSKVGSMKASQFLAALKKHGRIGLVAEGTDFYISDCGGHCALETSKEGIKKISHLEAWTAFQDLFKEHMRPSTAIRSIAASEHGFVDVAGNSSEMLLESSVKKAAVSPEKAVSQANEVVGKVLWGYNTLVMRAINGDLNARDVPKEIAKVEGIVTDAIIDLVDVIYEHILDRN
jgi:hypothetical protein